MLAELSSERSTPRKLNTPSKKATPKSSAYSNATPARPVVGTPTANSGQRRVAAQVEKEAGQTASAPKSLPPKLERRGPASATPVQTQSTLPAKSRSVPSRNQSVSSVQSPFDPTGKDHTSLKGTALRMVVPRENGIAPNPTERSPLLARNVMRIPTIVMDGEALLPPIVSPSPGQPTSKINGHGATDLTVQRIRRIPHRTKPGMNGRSTASVRSVVSTDIDAQSTASSRSRKRKLENRTPQGPKTRTANGASKVTNNHDNAKDSFRGASSNAPSSRSVSIASGPRKLSRISSVTKQANGARGAVSVDSRKDTSSNASRSNKGQPRKLRNGRRTETAQDDRISTK